MAYIHVSVNISINVSVIKVRGIAQEICLLLLHGNCLSTQNYEHRTY
jgi:hypothetical protein